MIQSPENTFTLEADSPLVYTKSTIVIIIFVVIKGIYVHSKAGYISMDILLKWMFDGCDTLDTFLFTFISSHKKDTIREFPIKL